MLISEKRRLFSHSLHSSVESLLISEKRRFDPYSHGPDSERLRLCWVENKVTTERMRNSRRSVKVWGVLMSELLKIVDLFFKKAL